jgi:hypothetical protein
MDSVVGTPAGGGSDDEDLIYVRSHLLRYQHTCQFPREWHVDEWQEPPSGATHQVCPSALRPLTVNPGP